jgi:hypothetical protein
VALVYYGTESSNSSSSGVSSIEPLYTVVGVLEKAYSAKPAQLSSRTALSGYIGWTRFQTM